MQQPNPPPLQMGSPGPGGRGWGVRGLCTAHAAHSLGAPSDAGSQGLRRDGGTPQKHSGYRTMQPTGSGCGVPAQEEGSAGAPREPQRSPQQSREQPSVCSTSRMERLGPEARLGDAAGRPRLAQPPEMPLEASRGRCIGGAVRGRSWPGSCGFLRLGSWGGCWERRGQQRHRAGDAAAPPGLLARICCPSWASFLPSVWDVFQSCRQQPGITGRPGGGEGTCGAGVGGGHMCLVLGGRVHAHARAGCQRPASDPWVCGQQR